MKRVKLLLMVASAVSWTAGTVQAADFVDTGDGLWSTGANWSTGVVPDAAEWVKISNANPAHQIVTIGAGVMAVGGKCHLGYTGGGTINIVDGGTLMTVYGTQDGDLLLGKQGGDGIINLIDGTINVGRDLEVGQGAGISGILNMTSGTITVADDFEIAQIAGTTGIVNLDGGVIQLTGFYEGDSQLRMYAGGLLNFGGGTLILPGDQRSKLQGYFDNGWITSDLGGVAVDLDMNPGYTTVYAVVPEPATMILLGLGSLMTRKKK